MPRDRESENIDSVLAEFRSILNEEDDPATQEDRSLRQKIGNEGIRSEDDYYSAIVRSTSENADRAVRRNPATAKEPEMAQEVHQRQTPNFVAYNSDFHRDSRFHDNFAPRQSQTAQGEEAAEPMPRKPAGASAAEREASKPHKVRKQGIHTGLAVLIVLVLLAAIAFFAVRIFGSVAKKSEQNRIPGMSNVLIAGTDEDGLRTDVLMLLSFNEKEKTYSILSIPRDTLTYAPYSVPKINGAYGYYGCGEEGMDKLLGLVQDCIGFRPDAYLLVNFDVIVELTDLMGGLAFHVPMQMDIGTETLPEGMQILNGSQVLGLARFRSGYALADLERIEVQRQIIGAAKDQWLKLENLTKFPSALRCLRKHSLTDMNLLNLIWLARDMMRFDGGISTTLPGSAQMIGDGSYYVLDPKEVARVITESFSPFVQPITESDLYIKVG